jgi:hypothetical protein
VIFLFIFISSTFYHYIFHLFVFKVFLSFRATFCFTSPDYCLIQMTCRLSYSELVRVYCYLVIAFDYKMSFYFIFIKNIE